MPAPRIPPITVEASAPPSNPAHAAAIIFIHGLDDDAEGVAGIAQQFKDGNKLPHMRWVLPNAMENRDAMANAWYLPTHLPALPSQRPELDDDEDEDGLKFSRKYIVGLIDEIVESGVPAGRIVLGGFSQGHAMALFTGLTSSKYAGRLGGLVGVCGYLPLMERIGEVREEEGLSREVRGDDVPMLISRGGKDMLVPGRVHNLSMERLRGLGVREELIETHVYPENGHAVTGNVLKDLCAWLEKTVPPIAE